MKLELRCGDVIQWTEGMEPICPVHGPQGVARTIGAPAPRFRGTATGPHCQTVDLAPFTGRIAGSDPRKD